MIYLKTEEEIELLRKANLLVSATLTEIAKVVRPGVTTRQLDTLAEQFIRDHGAIPTFKGFPSSFKDGTPFPASICTSVNNIVIHGIPDDTPLKDGDIVVLADDAMKLRQVQELLRGYVTRRKLDVSCLDFGKEENASGGMIRQIVKVKQGVPQDVAKKIAKAVKESKMKVQTAIQGDEIRVTGKKRDDLQAVIALVKTLDADRPLQYVNFRD